jgi:hypothetical protein
MRCPAGMVLVLMTGVLLSWPASTTETKPPARGATMPDIQYLANYEKKGVSLTVTVNDVVLDRWEGAGRERGGGPLNMWLRPGPNRIRLRGTVAPGTEPHVEISIVAASSGPNFPQKPIVGLSWPAPKTEPKSIDEQLIVTPDPVPPSELWGKAERLTLDAVSKAAILVTVSQLHQAAAKKDLDRMMALTDFQAVDTGRSLYMPLEKARNSGRDFLADGMKGKWSVDPWEPQKVETRLVEDGLLAEVTMSGKPPIRIHMAETQFQIPIFVARVSGKWIIAR